MRLRNIMICSIISGMVALSACNGKADKDGNKSIEGHNDPANTGGSLSGDHGMDQSSGVEDTTAVKK